MGFFAKVCIGLGGFAFGWFFAAGQAWIDHNHITISITRADSGSGYFDNTTGGNWRPTNTDVDQLLKGIFTIDNPLGTSVPQLPPQVGYDDTKFQASFDVVDVPSKAAIVSLDQLDLMERTSLDRAVEVQKLKRENAELKRLTKHKPASSAPVAKKQLDRLISRVAAQ